MLRLLKEQSTKLDGVALLMTDPPLMKLHPSGKITVTFEPIMQFQNSSGFIIYLSDIVFFMTGCALSIYGLAAALKSG